MAMRPEDNEPRIIPPAVGSSRQNDSSMMGREPQGGRYYDDGRPGGIAQRVHDPEECGIGVAFSPA